MMRKKYPVSQLGKKSQHQRMVWVGKDLTNLLTHTDTHTHTLPGTGMILQVLS